MSSPTVKGVERALIQQRERLETLTEISRVVSATLDLRTLYDTIYQQVGRVMDTTRFFIALHRPDHNMIQLPYHREDGELGIDAEVPYGKSVTTSVIEQGIALLFRNSDDYSTFAHKNQLPEITIGDEGSQSMIFVPLNTGSRTIGAMSVQCTARDVYTPDDVQTLSVIASQAAVAIVNARLYRQGEALLQAANKISSSHGLQAVLDAILNGMYDVMSYSFATIFLPNFAQERLEIVGAAGEAALQRRGALTVHFGKGVTGRVFATGHPMIVPDVRLHSDYIGDGVTEVGSEIAVPLKHNDTVIGVLNVERSEVDAFTREDLNLLTLFASQVALAIENARLFSEQENRVFELQTIQSIVQKLTPLHNPAFIADLIDRELKALIDYHSCRLFVLDQAEDRLLPMNEAANDRPGWQPRVGEGITGWIAQRGQPVLIENTLEDTRVTQIPGTPRRVESLVGAPLVYEGRVRGVITLSKLGVGQFDRNSLRLLEIVAAQTAIAFDRARLYDELKTDAVTDDLTKLHNRRYLLERFREERSRAVRNQHALAVIMLDIDKFKSVNDTYGHDAGDVVLCELADVVRRIVRAEDIVARYGGEEFCVLLPETSFDGVDEAAERLRSTVESHLLPHRAGIRQITVSVGVSMLEVGDSGTEVLTRADQALYRVKAEGGNRVCILHGETPHFNEEKSGDAGDDVAAPSASEEIADLRRAEAALHHQALYDSLTGLPNRTLLIDRLQQAVLTSNRESAPVGLLLMDLDRFKDLNDALGYSVGDRLLREIAGRLRSMLRETDTVARLGDDEYAIVLPGADVAGASLVADKILQKLYEPFTIEERLIHARISIGIVLYPEHGGDVSTLLRCADVAMHAAKQIGNCYEVYAPALNKHDAAGLELAGQLRQAIDRNQLTLHYQPKVRLSDNSLAGVEALVRWQHPERGLVSPVHFVPFAEHTGMIRPLTNWVLGQALRQCGEWRRSGLALQIAVNLSARNLHDPALLRTVSELLREHALDPSYLRLEIVESTVMSDPTRALQVLQRFSDMGVGIAVDDFGTGYSSLTYLKKLPVHEVKIDKSFVTDMSHDAEAGVIVSSVIDLGHNLGLQVTAEGVEDRQSLALLKAQGCDLAQGYFLSRPIPPEQLSGWIQDTLRSTETWRSQPSPAFAAT